MKTNDIPSDHLMDVRTGLIGMKIRLSRLACVYAMQHSQFWQAVCLLHVSPQDRLDLMIGLGSLLYIYA